MESLTNKSVVVVGATGGIGSETVKLLKKSQANIFITGRNREILSKLAEEVGIPQDQCHIMDITNPQEVEKTAAAIHAKAQPIDILINAAGIGILHPVESLSYDDFGRSIDVNLKGAFHLVKNFLPPMKEAKKGLIINLPGVLGKTPMAGAAAYAASKYGLNGMLKSIREELKRTNVRITNIYFGGVDSAFWDEIDLRVNREKMIHAREAARAIWFLCQQPDTGVVSEMVIQPFNHQVI